VIALFIMVLAFGYRVQIIWDRANAPNEISVFDPIPRGVDQYVYYNSVAQYRAGTFPPPTYFYQPGPSWFLVGVSLIMRTDNAGALRIFVAALASINVGLMIAAARLAFGRRWVSLLAGLLLAVYPVSAFYDTDFVITSQSTILVTISLFGILWLWRSPRNWTGAILFGLSIGALLLTRRELVALAPVLGLWLLWQRRDWKALLQLALGGIIAIAVILPVTEHNRIGGAGYLITPVSSAEFYRGNNRDTDGTFGGKQASTSTHTNYERYLIEDILLSPTRFIELELHKIGMYLSSTEPGNNLSYGNSGTSVSAVLRSNPFSFTILLMLFLYGLYALWREREQTLPLFGLMFLAMLAATLTIWVEARIRTPVIVCMIPVAAYGIVWLAEHLPLKTPFTKGLQFNASTLRLLLIPLPFMAVIQVFSDWGTYSLPRAVTMNNLPADVPPYHAIYDGNLELVGFKVQEQYSPAGIIEPYRPYVVSFYWRVLAPTTIDYSFSLKYMRDGESIISFDHPIGAVAHPGAPTSSWQPGDIYVEHVGISWPDVEGTTFGLNGDLLLYVYPERDAARLLHAEGLPDKPLAVQISQLAIMLGVGKPATLPQRDALVTFGDLLRLRAWELADTAAADEPVPVALGWETTSTQIKRSYSIAVYAFASNGEFVAQADSPPYDGNLLTFSLPVNYYFEDTKTLTMPDKPDTYALYVGIYDNATMERLAIPGSSDNLARIGTITVIESD
jgi:hypothetical protein